MTSAGPPGGNGRISRIVSPLCGRASRAREYKQDRAQNRTNERGAKACSTCSLHVVPPRRPQCRQLGSFSRSLTQSCGRGEGNVAAGYFASAAVT